MNKYQEALDRLGSINLDLVQDTMEEKSYEVSVYCVHEYPVLEMSGDIKTLQELVNKEKSVKPEIKTQACDFCGSFGIYMEFCLCPECGNDINQNENYCSACGQKLDWSE